VTRAVVATWGAVLVATALSAAVSLMLSPPLWQDEGQIVELGRTALGGDATWSPNWLSSGHPTFVASYLGPQVQELAFEATSPSGWGPRVSSLAAALFAATIFLAFLLSRGVAPWICVSLASALLLDPIFVASYRGGRADGHALALGLASCLLLQVARDTRADLARSALFCASGIAVVLGIFTWASCVLMLPLVGWELVGSLRSSPRRILPLGFACIGAVGCAAMLLGHLSGQLAGILRDAPEVSAATLSVFDAPHVLSNLGTFLRAARASPAVFILSIGAATFRVNRTLAVLAALTLIYLLTSFAYGPRVLYLLPMLLTMCADAAAVSVRAHRRAVVVGLASTVLWCVGVSVVARTVKAEMEKTLRNPDATLQLARQAIPTAGKRVYLGTWELYFAGRMLGWQMVRPYLLRDSEQVRKLAATVDYAVLPASSHSTEAIQLRQLLPRTRLLSSDAPSVYGPYEVLCR
jgi:hypothetical protein